MREKYILSQELREKDIEITGDKRLSLLGPASAMGALLPNTAVIRQGMHIKHEDQRLVLNNPEFPYVYTGAENVMGEQSSFYEKTDKDYQVFGVVKKYEGLLKGKSNIALYFLYSKDDDSYTVIERKAVENLTEKFGFEYNNDYIDSLSEGEKIHSGTVLYNSTSYDEHMNLRTGVNARMLFQVSPYVTEDAIVVSESFAKKMVSNKIISLSIPLNENAMLLNLYGDKDEYKGLPDIGEHIKGNILAATRQIQGNRLFSDLRDNSLNSVNFSSDNVFYADGEIIDIDVYCNNKDIKQNFVNSQIIRYLNDEKIYYSKIYKICKKIINSGSKNIDPNIKRWMRLAMNFIDDEARWAYNDSTFSNIIIELLIKKSEPISIGRKISGRYGNKTVVSTIWKDEDMPYIVDEVVEDKYGVKHAVGEKKRIDLMTNPLAIINRTIAAALYENSITFITDRIRNKLNEMTNQTERENLLFDVLSIFNKKQSKRILKEYNKLSEKNKERFFKECVDRGIFVQKQPFDPDDQNIRDSCIELYKKYPDILQPYHLFIPKRNWGRDIHIGQYNIGYQYILLLKQDGEKGFSSRSAGSISDEGLPEKSNESKIGRAHSSSTPIRFGEYELPTYYMNILEVGIFS